MIKAYLRNISLVVAGLAILAFQTSPANAAKTINLTNISGFPPFIIFVKVFEDVLVPSVEKRLAEAGGKYKIRWTRAYGASIAKEENTLEAIADGLGDIGFVPFIFEQAKLPLPVVTYVAPFVSYDPRVLGEVQDEMYRDIPELNEGWHKQNQIYLAGTMINSFQIFSRVPIRSVEDLKGMKFGLAGPLASWLKGTGAVSVHNPVTEGYQALKSGMIDAQLIFPTGAFAFKFYEPAPYVVKANLGAAWGTTISFNKKRWDGLPREVREAFRAAAKDHAKAYPDALIGLGNHIYGAMDKAGAKVSTMAEAERVKWAMQMPNVARQWADSLEAKGLPARRVLSAYIDGVRKRGGKIIRDWSK